MVPRVPLLDDGGPGLPLLVRITLFEIVIMMIPGITVGIGQGFHGHDGPHTTQLDLVLDNDAGRFGESTDGCAGWFLAFTISTTRCRDAYECCLHRE